MTMRAVMGRPFLTFFRYARPYWRGYVIGAILSLLFMGLAYFVPLIVRFAIHHFEAGTMTFPRLLTIFLLMAFISAVAGVGRFIQRSLMIRASRQCEYDIRNDYFRALQRLSPAFFHRIQTGDLIARATNDLNFARMFLGPGIMGSIDLIRFPYALAFMIYLSPKLTLFALAPLPVVSILVYAFIMYNHRQSIVVQEQFSTVTAQAQENLAGARVVRAYGIGERETKRFTRESEIYMRESVKLACVMNLIWPVVGAVVGGTLLLILWRGGLMVMNQVEISRITLQFTYAAPLNTPLDFLKAIPSVLPEIFQGNAFARDTTPFGVDDLTGFILYLFLMAGPMAEFGWLITLYQRGAVGMNRLSEILCEPPEITESNDTDHTIAAIHGHVRFENISFAYNNHDVLSDISFDVPHGSTIAIVGPTGSGKSTLVRLLCRHYDPRKGRIYIDSRPITTIPLNTLRKNIALVPQDTFLFSDSIRNNICIGNPHATDQDVDRAADAAQFTETVDNLKDGFDTLLGERGVNLSGGQKQRLTIARALICDAPILLLDDALSSVDTHTEEEILQRLKKVCEDRTSFIISHRVSTVQHADQILVLRDGRIVQRGTHTELIAQSGLYKEMHQRQLLEDALDHES